MAIQFVSLNEALELHNDQVAIFGGSDGIRDLGLLQSALGMAEASFGGQHLHEFPHGMAAAYLFHVASNHPFIDGNKRAAFAIALAFLKLNRHTLGCTQTEAYEMTLAVAAGSLDKPAVVEFFKRHVRPA